MNIRSKLGLETYVTAPGPVAKPIINDCTDVDYGSPSGIISQVQDAAVQTEDLTASLHALESIAAAIEAAGDEDFTVTTASIIAAAIDDVGGPVETIAAEKMQNSGMGKAAAVRSAAKEALADKFASIKATIAKILARVTEMLEAFWRWITMNHKRVLKRLDNAKKEMLDASEKADLKFQKNWINLMHTNVFEPEKVGMLGGYLAELCTSAGTFIESGFAEMSKYAADPRLNIDVNPESMTIRIKAAFSNFKTTDHGEIGLYNGIAGRSLYVEIYSDSQRSISSMRPVFRMFLAPMKERSELPYETTVYKADMRKIISGAVEAVDASEKHFDKVHRIRTKLRLWTGLAGGVVVGAPDPQLIGLVGMLASYNTALSACIDGIFTQSLRFGEAAASLAETYLKEATALASQGDTGPAPEGTLRLAAK